MALLILSTITGDTIGDYIYYDNKTGDTSTINEYITNNYTYITNNGSGTGESTGGGSGSSSGDVNVGGTDNVSGNVSVGGQIDINTKPIDINVIDRNADGYPEVYIPLPFDFSGDGLNDWGQVVDDDHDGVPDASDGSPFYPVGSDGFNQLISSDDSGKSLIIVSPDGNVAVYDPNGELQQEDFHQAYSLWLQDNAALDKPFAYYSVTEALLLIVALFAGVSLVGKLFKRRNYHGHY